MDRREIIKAGGIGILGLFGFKAMPTWPINPQCQVTIKLPDHPQYTELMGETITFTVPASAIRNGGIEIMLTLSDGTFLDDSREFRTTVIRSLAHG